MMHDGGWFGMGGGWIWTVFALLVVVVVVINKLSKK